MSAGLIVGLAIVAAAWLVDMLLHTLVRRLRRSPAPAHNPQGEISADYCARHKLWLLQLERDGEVFLYHYRTDQFCQLHRAMMLQIGDPRLGLRRGEVHSLLDAAHEAIMIMVAKTGQDGEPRT